MWLELECWKKYQTLFHEGDTNTDGNIDFNEFVEQRKEIDGSYKDEMYVILILSNAPFFKMYHLDSTDHWKLQNTTNFLYISLVTHVKINELRMQLWWCRMLCLQNEVLLCLSIGILDTLQMIRSRW